MSYRDDLSTYFNNVGDEPHRSHGGWWRRILSSLGQAARSFAGGGGVGPWGG